MKRTLLSLLVATSIAHADGLTSIAKTELNYEDIADAAAWINGDTQWLITTQEGDGFAIFDKDGKKITADNSKETAGADIRYGVQHGDKSIDVVAFGRPDDGAIGFYQITGNSDAAYRELGELAVDFDPEVVCLGKNSTTGELYVNASEGDNLLHQYKLQFDGKTISSILTKDGKAEPVRQINVGGEISGCVVDDQTRTLYIAEQDVGIWQYGAEPENIKDRVLLDVVVPLGHLKEVEGIDMLYRPDGKGYLVIADEGAGIVIYERDSGKYVNTIKAEGFEEHKGLALAPDAIWLMNSELDEPIYERIEAADFAKAAGITLDDAVSVGTLGATDLHLVSAQGETEAVDNKGDAADDSAIWVNPQDASQSLIIATDKKGGLLAYDLDGKQIQYLEEGRPNNVDIRQGVKLGEKTYDLAAATNRDANTVTLYHIVAGETPISKLTLTGDNTKDGELISAVDEVYGLCMFQAKDGTPYVFANGKNGVTEQWKISTGEAGLVGEKVRELKVGSQPEGCVTDDDSETLYVGEEDVAIWTFDAKESGSTEATLFAKVDGKNLVADVEGITLYAPQSGNKYLIASSQGNNSYSIYNVADKSYVGSFAIKGDDTAGLDGASDTDGVEVKAVALGDKYPQGLFIAQDFYNIDKDYAQEKQNFKFVGWDKIVESFGDKLK